MNERGYKFLKLIYFGSIFSFFVYLLYYWLKNEHYIASEDFLETTAGTVVWSITFGFAMMYYSIYVLEDKLKKNKNLANNKIDN